MYTDFMDSTISLPALRSLLEIKDAYGAGFRDLEIQKDIYRRLWPHAATECAAFTISDILDDLVIAVQLPDGRRLAYLEDGAVIVPSIHGRKVLAGNKTVFECDWLELLETWQALVFPNHAPDRLALQSLINDFRAWQAWVIREPLVLGDEQFSVIRLLGLGKESKVYEVEDEHGKAWALKIGVQSLQDEYEFGIRMRAMESRLLTERFPSYERHFGVENAILFEYVPGEEAHSYVDRIATENEWQNFLAKMLDTVEDISKLHDAGIAAGQFNFHNILIEEGLPYRIIDPFYEGDLKVYEAKQVLRIAGTFARKLYGADPDQFFHQLRLCNTCEELADVRFPAGAAESLEKNKKKLPAEFHLFLCMAIERALWGDQFGLSLNEFTKSLRQS